MILGDYLKLAQSLSPNAARRSLFYVLSPNACRLSQYPVSIDIVRQRLGLSLAVILDIDHGLEAFGLSRQTRHQVLLRIWEGLNAV